MNRTVFFDRVRARPFGGSLTKSQVEGMEAILDAAGRFGLTDVRHLAYALATAFLETARTMQPIKEIGGAAYFTKMYDIKGDRPAKARELGNLTPGDGAKYAGRGYVQLTGRNNFDRAGKKIGVDLVASPDLAMVPDNAARIMFSGMTEGWFTSKKLADYFSTQVDDPTNARRIINGTDKASTIAGYHVNFLSALKAAGWAPGASTPLPPDVEPPLILEPKPAEPTSIWAAIFAGLAALFKR